jgi:general stress protein CsbA
LIISDCSEPLPLIGVLADWLVNDGDNTLGLIGLPDRVNIFGLDVLGLVGRLTVIGLLLGFSSGFVIVGIDVLGLAAGLAMTGLPPLVYFNWDNGLLLAARALIFADTNGSGVIADWLVNDGSNTLGLIGLPDRVNAVRLDVLGLAVGLTVIGLLLGFSSGFVVVGIDVLGLAGGLALIGLPPLVYFNWDNGLLLLARVFIGSGVIADCDCPEPLPPEVLAT